MWSHWRAEESDGAASETRGPAPPATVAASGKKAFAWLSTSEEAKMEFQKELSPQSDDSPVISPDTAILVRSSSGQNLQIPNWSDELRGGGDRDYGDDSCSSETDSFGESSYTESSSTSHEKGTDNTERRNKNLQWLRVHFQSLTEVGNLVFNNADLWQLHQYFFSPAYGMNDDNEPESTLSESSEHPRDGENNQASSQAPPPTPVASDAGNSAGIERAISFQTLGKAVAAAADVADSRPNKRGSLEETLKDAEPCAKRAKNLKPRIAYYPRIRVS